MAEVEHNYISSLDAAWQDHLAPRAPDAPTVISTFAGCGGSSLGYSMAGYRELMAVEWDSNAVATFKLNLPDVFMYHGDIAKLTVGKCLFLAGLKPGELDVLNGSPPCQGFSTAGKRILDDPRNSLFREYVRLLRGLQPKAFVMENVSGMVKGKMKLVFTEIMRELKASGYIVKARVLNAMYYGVPQSRERMIIIGVREDVQVEPEHPKGQNYLVIFQDATSDICHEAPDIKFNPGMLTAKAMKQAKQGESDPRHFTTLKLDQNRQCPTLRHDFLGYLHYWHPIYHRPLNLNEWKRCASYPDSFTFTDKINGCQRIGNSVPPLFARAIASHVRGLLESPP